MKFIEYLKKETIVIAPKSVQMELLRELDQADSFYAVHFLTREEFLTQATFSYTEKTIAYLVQMYGWKVDVARTYLSNMQYVEDNDYGSSKLQQLISLKQELFDQGYLLTDSLFPLRYCQKQVLVLGYDRVDRFFQKQLNQLRDCPVQIVPREKLPTLSFHIYEYETLEAEVVGVVYQICQLISDGIGIEQIKLAHVTDDYCYLLKKYCAFYGLPLRLDERVSLYSTSIGIAFIRGLETATVDEVIAQLQNQYRYDDVSLHVLQQIVGIVNQYVGCTGDLTLLYEDALKRTYLPQEKRTQVLETISFANQIIKEDWYVFVLGVNQGQYPKMKKDEDFLSDALKEKLGIETSYEENQIQLNQTIETLSSLSHVVLTYKLNAQGVEYYPSAILDRLGMVEYGPQPDRRISYSKLYDLLQLGGKLDQLTKYNTIDQTLGDLYHNYETIPYHTYSNQFQGISKDKLLAYYQPKLTLSYSKIDTYFKCGFRYYCDHVLRLKGHEETFVLLVGNLFHKVLSLGFQDDYSFDEEVQAYLQDKTLSAKEEFLLRKLIRELRFIITVIKEQNEQMGFDKSLYEEAIFVDKSMDIEVLFMGVVDKILYGTYDGRDYVSVVDYKTGMIDTNLNHVIYGLGMQLPIYLYLIRHSKQFQDPQLVGFYLQKILYQELPYSSTKTYDEMKADLLKLNGYTISDESSIALFDKNYGDSRIIKGMKKGKNGFYRYTKLLSSKQMDRLVDLVDKKIDESVKGILDGRFKINPKRIGMDNQSCQFCPYADICFHTEDDVVVRKEYKNLEFLGGDQDE